jgi:uncharacterized NAD(P)/FAD-binding protein YdhS
MVAVNLARRAPKDSIALIDRTGAFGPGLAYGTADFDHLLNVRARDMGAFADDPGHFWRWLESSGNKKNFNEKDFVPRGLYGQYLVRLLGESRQACPVLSLVERQIVDIIPLPAGGFELIDRTGNSLTADKVVLALGNFPPAPVASDIAVQNPYAPRLWQEIADDRDVLIVGTGLTSLDLVATLARSKGAGTVHLLSRHGLLPREHVETGMHKLALGKGKLPNTALGLYHAVRREVDAAAAQNLSWHSAIDALRPFNQQIWQGLNTNERRRFLRHLRVWWEVCRHRCARPLMDAYRALEQKGRLKLHRGSILMQTPAGDGWNVKWRPRGRKEAEILHVAHVVHCTGPQADFAKLPDPLVQNLLKRKLIAPDSLHLGIETADDYAVLGADFAPVLGLYALGSLLKGRLYESTAVPELRRQASEVADILAG